MSTRRLTKKIFYAILCICISLSVLVSVLSGCDSGGREIGGLGIGNDPGTLSGAGKSDSAGSSLIITPGSTSLNTGIRTPEGTAGYTGASGSATVAAPGRTIAGYTAAAPERTGGSGETTPAEGTATKAPAALVTQEYDGGTFKLTIPKGWKMESGGSKADFWFRVTDPVNVDLQIFYYGKLEPFLKSAEASAVWKMIDTTGVYSAAPVMTDRSARGLLSVWSQCIEYQKLHGTSTFTTLNNIVVDHLEDFDGMFASSGAVETIARASCAGPSGAQCKIVLSTALIDSGTYYANGVDTMHMTCYNTMGMLTPADVFDAYSETLAKCLNSLTFKGD
ncbi:MAG: hypothetical protein PHG48_01815 [Eubacteriales bacterium]|nr:hypothetical protein [Eubacteriales bacterium]